MLNIIEDIERAIIYFNEYKDYYTLSTLKDNLILFLNADGDDRYSRLITHLIVNRRNKTTLEQLLYKLKNLCK